MKFFTKKIPKIIFWSVLSLFLVYTAAGFFIVPMVIKSQAINYIKIELKREAEIESVSFNPFTFSLSVEGFKLYEKEKKEIFISFKEFFINFSLMPLINKELDFQEIRLTEPKGNVIRLNQEEFNFSDLIKKLSNPNTDTVTTDPKIGPVKTGIITDQVNKEESNWEILIRKFELERLYLLITDKSIAPPAETKIDSFSVTVTDLHLNSADTSGFHLTSKLRRGGTFSLSGNFSMTPLKADLKFSFNEASLVVLSPYISDFAYLRLDDGKLSIDGNLKLNEPSASDKIQVSFNANSKLEDLKLYDTKNDERFLEWKTLTVLDIKGTFNPTQISIGEVDLKNLYARIAIAEDKSFNLSELFKVSPAAEDSGEISDTLAMGFTDPNARFISLTDTNQPFVESVDTGKNQIDFEYDIGKIKIENSEVFFSDFSLPLKFASKIHNMNGEVTGFTSENPLGAEIKLQGTVDEYGLAKIEGKMDPFDPIAYSNIKVNFHNIEMTNLTPYSIDFIGYYLESGKLSLDIQYKIDKGILTSYSKIFLNKFTLGDEVEGEEGLGLPIKLAIALLKDANDNIDLDLEVEGDLNDPETDTGALVWWAVKRVLTTIVTAPFRFLGNLLGIGGEDLESIDFEAGNAKLENHQFEKMINLSKIIAERPGIVLEIYGAVDTITDGRAIREAKFDSIYNYRLTGQNFSDSSSSPTNNDYTKGQQIIEELYVQSYDDSTLSLIKIKNSIDSDGNGDLRNYLDELREKIILVQPVSVIEFQNLATTRAEAIQNHMLTVHQIPAERIVIKENEIFEEEDRNWVRCPLGVGVL